VRWRTHITLMLGAMLTGLAATLREAATTARAWLVELALSRSLVSRGLPFAPFMPFVREPRREDEWRDLPQLPPTARPISSAPDTFTASVMARIERRPVVTQRPWVYSPAHIRRAIRLIAGTLGASAAIALVSSAALALLAPAEALGLLAALLSLAVLLLALLRNALQFAGAVAANDALMLGLGLALGAAIVIWSRSARILRPLREA
jgi:hypothetical protein